MSSNVSAVSQAWRGGREDAHLELLADIPLLMSRLETTAFCSEDVLLECLGVVRRRGKKRRADAAALDVHVYCVLDFPVFDVSKAS